MGNALFMHSFNSDILYVDAPHIVSIEQCLLKRHQGTKVLKQKLMKWNLSLFSGNKLLMIPRSPENSQAVDYTVLSALLPYYSRDTGLRGNVCFCFLPWPKTQLTRAVCGGQNNQLPVFRSSSFDQIVIVLNID